MKPRVISAERLFEEHQPTLRWEWIAGHAHPERRFDEAAVREARSAADLVGYLNYIHPYRVQLVGRREVAYLADASDEIQQRRIQRIVTLEPPVIIVADDERPPDKLVALCDRAEIPLFVTSASASRALRSVTCSSRGGSAVSSGRLPSRRSSAVYASHSRRQPAQPSMCFVSRCERRPESSPARAIVIHRSARRQRMRNRSSLCDYRKSRSLSRKP